MMPEFIHFHLPILHYMHIFSSSFYGEKAYPIFIAKEVHDST